VKRIPNAVAFVVFISLTVTVTSVMTTPSGSRLAILVGGLITTLLVGVVVAGAVWLRARLRRDRRTD
jgi:hypothetical protein